MASLNPPPGLIHLIELVQKKRPGLSFNEALDIIKRVKKLNGGLLKGLKIVKFVKLVNKAVRGKIEQDKSNFKEKKQTESRLNKTCPICFSYLSTKRAKERHMKVHIKENSRETDDEIPTIDEEMLDFNENVEITDKSEDENEKVDKLPVWRCKVCGKEYSHEGSLTRHSKEHDEIKPISCNLCEVKFRRKDNWNAHMRKVHNTFNINFEALRNTEENSNTCKMCGEAFESVKQFEAHIVFKVCSEPAEDLKVIEDKYQCDLCDRAYKHKKSLIAHLDWKHRNKKTYKCEICDVVYTHRSSLERHRKKLH